MSKLEAPINRHLNEQCDEHTVQRVWNAVRARRGRSLFVQSVRIPTWAWAVAGALALAALLFAGAKVFAPPVAHSVALGPLTSRTGDALAVLGGRADAREELSDGSAISLDAGSQLEVLENNSKSFVSALRRGRGSFSVKPGGPRRWTIEAGLLTVEVVGTRFSVTRSENTVDVAVEHGVVLVRSELIADRVQRLTAGEHLSIRLPAPTSVTAATVPEPPASAVAPTLSAAPVAPPPSVAPAVDNSLEGLLTTANEQRRRGDVRAAEASLRRALSEHPSDPRTALVAFTLGKLLFDAAGRPAEAAQAFERCLSAAPPSALAEDALFRLAQAQAQAGSAQAASKSAERYQSLYPQGRHAHDVERWVLAR